MNVYIPLGIILAFFCFFAREDKKLVNSVFIVSFLAMLVFLTLRYQFGPDYISYLTTFESIQGEDVSLYTGVGASSERGFLYYLSLFPYFTLFIFVNAVFWLFANYNVLHKYVNATEYWIVVLYIFFNNTYLKLSTVAMRSTMVAFIFMFAFMFLMRERKIDRIIYVALILLAGQFHTTGLALIPFVFINSKNTSILFNKIFIGVIALIGFVSFFAGNNVILQYVSEYVMDNIEAFDRYADDDVSIGVVSFSLNTFIFYLMSVFVAFWLAWAGRQETNKEFVYIYKVAIIAAIVQILFRQSMISDRYFMCFNPFYITALVHSLYKGRKQMGIVALMFVAVISLYIFTSKMNKSYARHFETYHTIFEAPQIP